MAAAMIPFLMVSAVVPSLLLMWFFHARDVFREPPKVLWATFFLGVLTIPGVLLVVLPFEGLVGLEEINEPYTQGFSTAFLHAAVPEEFFKFLVLYFYARRNPAFDEPADGIVYGVASSLGFATLENIMYVVGGGIGTAVMRAFTAVPAHAFFGAIMGYFVGQARFRPHERGKLIAAALFWPMLLHGLYDAPLLTLKAMGEATSAVLPLLGAFLVVLVWTSVWALRLAGRLREEQLALLAQMQGAAAHAGQAQVHMGFAVPHPAVPPQHLSPHPPTSPTPPHPAQAYASPHFAGRAGPAAHAPAGGPPPAWSPPGAPQRWATTPHPQGFAPRWPAAPMTRRRNDGWKGWLLILGSIPLAGFGGIMVLGSVLLLGSPGDAGVELGAIIAVLVVAGLLPLGIGIGMFAMAIRIFNRSG